MARKRNRFRMMAVWSVLLLEPGLTMSQVAKRLDLKWHQVKSTVVSMDRTGFLLSEDDAGGLYADRIVRLDKKAESV